MPGSLPVLFFGDLFAAQVVTVGINPSKHEYLDRDGVELDAADRRFESLRSLGCADRSRLSARQCERAIGRMRAYFDAGGNAYWRWFRPLRRVLDGMGFSLEQRSAAHLDLVQEPTDPVWGSIPDKTEQNLLLAADLPFLHWQITHFKPRIVICTSKTVLRHVTQLLGATPVDSGSVDGSRMSWHVALATVGGAPMAVAGWNYPLSRAHGLTHAGLSRMGEHLRKRVDRATAL